MKVITVIVFIVQIGVSFSQKTDDFYKSGQLKSRFEYANDTVLSAKHYWNNGILQKTYQCSYPEGITIIESKTYTRKGILINSERTLNGWKDGVNQIYYKNGKIRIDALDIEGVRVKELYYDKKGVLTKEASCDSISEECLVKLYNKQGEIKKKYSATFNGYGTILYK